jgi:flotillin
MQKGETAKADAELNISNAQRERDVIKAKNAALIQSEQARIPIAAQIATADETKHLNVSQVEAQKARVMAETELQAEEKKRHQAQLDASIIVEAEKQKEAKIILADAEQQAASRNGEAKRILSEKEGQGTQAKLTAEAEGRKAAALARQRELESEAAGERAKLIAQADGEKARLLAEAEGVRVRLNAEAEGALKKAEAYKALDDAGRFLMIMQVSPDAIRAIGEVVRGFMEPTAHAIGEGLSNVEEIRLIDLGHGNSGDGKNVLSQFVNMPAETIFALIQKLKATGMAPAIAEIAKKAGVDLTALFAEKAKPDSANVEIVPPDSPKAKEWLPEPETPPTKSRK